ncbi:MAG: hypothetical protein A2275_02945 [Bacteroidetes bacterium RIFOXYA12_FULL_35_11]|nr:MAG: hypothetical protein A2X01_01900 [Bacteroidetes bacterium GWF2_35_48]OFY75735.1 MAG: hypothetical protein A2275_02945 [Bacteroidetes bacterium RIFOXYA12_FULL_35_11]OFY97520.1 MAG: hypothetical protein A2491_00515 [Bacteroidetes bacterium RIFOXYC12_FULL_35_7]OFY97717.1 MAG: hypothetical protein A2309_13715 [Bacteroidetes bacterium RIFOXYB2_FULL_35_7]HBX51514.1 hypothetical protein [Bacteroidales bacterium]
MKGIIILYFLFGCYFRLFSGNTDSLFVLADKLPEKEKCKFHLAIGNQMLNSSPTQSVIHAKEALKFALKFKNKKEEADALRLLGASYFMKSNYDTALFYLYKSLRLSEKQGEFKDKASALLNIGAAHTKLKKWDVAQGNYNEAILLFEKVGDILGISRAQNNLGWIYLEQNKYDKALESFFQSIDAKKKLNDQKGIAHSLGNIAIVYSRKNEYQNAIKYYNQSIKITEKENDLAGTATNYEALGQLYFKMKNYKLAEDAYKKSIILAKKSLLRNLIRANYRNLYLLKKQQSQLEDALSFYEKYIEIKDSISNEQALKQISELQVQYGTEKKEKEIIILKNEKIIQALEMSKQKNIKNLILIILLLIAISSFILYSRYLLKRQSETRLKLLNAQKDKFFSIIAHDLKGPFGAFLNISETISTHFNTLEKEDIYTLSKLSYDSAIHVQNLLHNLLQWAMTQTNSLNFYPESLNLSFIIHANLSLFNASALEKKIIVNTDINKTALVHADKNVANTVMRNLINNAIKFTEESGTINIYAVSQGDKFVITVEDTGIGISKSDIEKLFRIDIENSSIGVSKEKGTGLGLILCKEFLEKNGEKIWVESEEGKGTKVIFTLKKA